MGNRSSGNKRMILTLAVFLVAVSLAGLSSAFFNRQLAPVDATDKSVKEVRVERSSNTYVIASLLADHGLIRNQKCFVWYCRIHGYDARLQAGRYQFSPSQGVEEIAAALIEGRVVTRSITIPEGYNLRQIGESAVSMGVCTADEWKAALTAKYEYDFLRDITQRENRLEGFLYPDTYIIQDETDAKMLVKMMLDRFDKVWRQEFAALASQQGLSVYRVVTLASMIEEEGKFDEERPRIAGVILNRLEAGMPLQIDATVLYSLGKHKERVLYRDLEVDSPYNTYKYPGLPPGPIASPGAVSIRAALQPEKHDYYYYVATPDGHHKFSRTYAEHLRAKK